MPKKLFKKIIIPIIILGFFLAPISPVLKNENGNLTAGIKTNKARAQEDTTNTLTTIELVATSDPTNESVSIAVTIANTKNYDAAYRRVDVYLYEQDPGELTLFSGNAVPPPLDSDYSSFGLSGINTVAPQILTPVVFEDLTVGQQYWVVGRTRSSDDANGNVANKLEFTLSADSNTPTTVTSTTSTSTEPFDYNCGIGILGSGTITGCVAELSYLLWTVSAEIMRLAGGFLDFFLYYATNSSAYTSVFVEKGWGLIRDVANIFFIIALLYIAIKTILSLNVTNNKKLIGTIVIIALLINFSLFVTQVIIDGSNILAKVFYNEIASKNEDQTTADPGAGGEKSIAVSLVSGFDPQTIVTSKDAYNNVFKPSGFIFVTLMMIFLTLYAAYMFFVVAILFVGRVVALWLAMIFSPLAFISYTLPFEIPFHHKKWWKDLLEAAFMAPIFIFFLYIIILFIQFGKEATQIAYSNSVDPTNSKEILLRIMNVVIPFAIIFLLLTRAKKLAVDYSGELGAMISKVGGTIMKVGGGAVLGAAAVAGGGALRATVGRAGSAVAGSAWAKDTRFGRAVGGLAGKFGKASFDIRGAKIAGKTLAGVTGMKMGETQKGGFEKMKADRVVKRQKRAEELKVGEHEPLKKNLYKEQADLRGLQVATNAEVAKMDKDIDVARQKLTDVSRMANGSSDAHGNTKDTLQKVYSGKLAALTNQKAHLREGKDYTASHEDVDLNGAITTNTITQNYDTDPKYKVNGKGLKTAEQAVKTAEFNIESAEYERINAYAKASSSKFANIMTGITGGSWEANIEAANKMKANLKPPKEENVK